MDDHTALELRRIRIEQYILRYRTLAHGIRRRILFGNCTSNLSVAELASALKDMSELGDHMFQDIPYLERLHTAGILSIKKALADRILSDRLKYTINWRLQS